MKRLIFPSISQENLHFYLRKPISIYSLPLKNLLRIVVDRDDMWSKIENTFVGIDLKLFEIWMFLRI